MVYGLEVARIFCRKLKKKPNGTNQCCLCSTYISRNVAKTIPIVISQLCGDPCQLYGYTGKWAIYKTSKHSRMLDLDKLKRNQKNSRLFNFVYNANINCFVFIE